MSRREKKDTILGFDDIDWTDGDGTDPLDLGPPSEWEFCLRPTTSVLNTEDREQMIANAYAAVERLGGPVGK